MGVMPKRLASSTFEVPRKITRGAGQQLLDHAILQGSGITSAQPEVEKLERIVTAELALSSLQQLELFRQASLCRALGLCARAQPAKVQLAHQVEHEYFEAHHVHERTLGDDHQLVLLHMHVDEAALKAEQAQEVERSPL